MLAAVRAGSERPAMRQVRDLLGHMPNAFGGHPDQTAEHHAALRESLLNLTLASKQIPFERVEAA